MFGQIIDRITRKISPLEDKPQVKEMIAASQYRERIEFLLKNKNLGNVVPKGGCLFSGRPNCHGTTLYVLGLSLEEAPYKRPASIGAEQIQKYLLESKVKSMDEANLVAFWAIDDNKRLCHTAVPLGRLEREEILFHMPNTGELFEVRTVKSYQLEYGFETPTYHKITSFPLC